MGLPRSYRRSPLAFPAGRAPAFDPTHIAASPSIRFSGIAGFGGAFINLLNGQPATKTGSPTTAGTLLGPAVNFASASNYNNVSNSFSDTPAAVTEAALVIPTSSVTFCNIFATCTGSANHNCDPCFLVLQFKTNGTTHSSGITLAQNQPYFVACSIKANAQNYIAVNLLTGQITTATATAAIAFTAPSSTWQIGSSYAAPDAEVAAVMYSLQFMSAPQLLVWALAPWDFWYPPTAFDAMLSKLRGSSAGFSVTATVLAAFEAAASPRTSIIVAEENEASLRAALFRLLSRAGRLRQKCSRRTQFARAVRWAAVAPEETPRAFSRPKTLSLKLHQAPASRLGRLSIL